MDVLSTEYKEWLSDNLEWMIDALGYEDFRRRPFINNSDIILHNTNDEGFFSFDEVACYLKEKLEIDQKISLQVEGDDIIETKHFTITIPSPLTASRELSIKHLTEELLLLKAKEIGLIWENNEDDAAIIGLLSIFYGISSLLWIDNQLTIKGNLVNNIVFEFCLAISFCIKDTELIYFLELFGKTAIETAEKAINTDDNIHKFQQLIEQFKRADRIIQDLNQANEMYQNRYYPLAISILQNLCNQHTTRITLWNTLGYYQQRNKQFKESIISFDQALLIDKDFVYALNNKGLSLLFLKDLNESKKYFLKAEQISPEEPFVLRNIGIFHSATNEFNKAKTYFKKAIEINDDIELVHYYYGIALLQNKEQEEAEKELKISEEKGEQEATDKLGKSII
jgi:tetratricopeptide (TPR) repeat protein